jgi:hypothetical protein
MADEYDQRLKDLLEEFRRDLAEIVVRAEKAVHEEIERIRAERLAELKGAIIKSQ